jgi:outer membrane protein assembly factor BamD (BamD/ComL family)
LTTWCKGCCQPIELLGWLLLGLIVAVSLYPSTAAAQQTVEERYQKAIQSFNEAKVEDACDVFQQIEKESPGYKDVHTYLTPACDSAKRTYQQEERLYKQGVDLFNQQQFEVAKQKFTQGRNLVLRHPKFRAEIDDYLKQIDTRMREEGLYQQAVQTFSEGRDNEASAQFSQIEQAKGARAHDASSYLERIKEREEVAASKKALENDQQAFDEAAKSFNDKRYPDAKARFQTLIQKGSPHATEAQSYLQRIDAAVREEAAVREKAKKSVVASGKDPVQVAQQFVDEARTAVGNGQYGAALDKLRTAEMLDPANHEAPLMLKRAQEMLDEQPLRLGLAAYFAGKYEEAEQQLGAYVANHGRKVALAYFFRGAAHASRYFLSGEQDAHEKELAMADFGALQKDSAQFTPPKQYVSPKILSLYSQAVSARQK